MAGVIMLSISQWAYPVSAGALDGMLVSVTNPSAYHSQNRMGAVGGDITLRTPNRNIQLITVDMPRLKMGCGAIDMFGGSFSFINADQLVTVFRNIGQIAVAALFKLAINSISHELGINMSEFSDIMNKLNNTRLNSCKIGEAIASDVVDAIRIDKKEKAKEAQGDLNTVQAISSTTKAFGAWWAGIMGSSKVNKADKAKNPHLGNYVWRAIWLNQVHKPLATDPGSLIPGGTNDAADQPLIAGLTGANVARLIMGITGSSIVKLDDTGSAVCKTDNSTPCESADQNQARNQLTVASLLYGSHEPVLNTFLDEEDGLDKTKTDDEFGWTTMSKTKMSVSQVIPGGNLYQLARQVLAGKGAMAADTMIDSNTATGGIVYYIKNGNWGDFPEAKNYLNAYATPILRHLVTVQRVPTAIDWIANTSSDLMAEQMAVAFAESLANAATAAFTGTTGSKVNKPKGYLLAIENFRRDIANSKTKSIDKITREKDLAIYVATMASTLGSGSLTLYNRKTK